MKTLQVSLKDKNRTDLMRIVSIICEYMSPDMIILFGKYADGIMRSKIGGYELLVVTEKTVNVNLFALYVYIDNKYPSCSRNESLLSIHILPVDYINTNISTNYFLYMIREEGVVLYSHNDTALRIKGKLKSSTVYKKAKMNCERCMSFGNTVLKCAERSVNDNELRLAAMLLPLAAEQFMLALRLVCYGYVGPKGILPHAFLMSRHCSENLAKEFDFRQSDNHNMFNRLQILMVAPRYHNAIPVKKSEIVRYIDRIRLLKEICGTSCEDYINMYDKLRFV